MPKIIGYGSWIAYGLGITPGEIVPANESEKVLKYGQALLTSCMTRASDS